MDCALFALPPRHLALHTPPVPVRRVYITTGHRRKLSPLTPRGTSPCGWQGRAKVKERKWLPDVEAILYARQRVRLERGLEGRKTAEGVH